MNNSGQAVAEQPFSQDNTATSSTDSITEHAVPMAISGPVDEVYNQLGTFDYGNGYYSSVIENVSPSS